MKLHLDWSDYANAGQGDAYAGIPATGGDFAKAVSVCIRDKHCQPIGKGVMCPSLSRHRRSAAFARRARTGAQGRAQRRTRRRAFQGRAGRRGHGPVRRLQGLQARMRQPGRYGRHQDRDAGAAQRHRRCDRLRDRLFAGLPRWLAWRGLLRAPACDCAIVTPGSRSWASAGCGIAASRRLPEPSPAAYAAPVPAASRLKTAAM